MNINDKSNKYVIDFAQEDSFHAGSKARSDINTILCGHGYTYIGIAPSKSQKRSSFDKISKNIKDIIEIIEKTKNIQPESIVLMQHPFAISTMGYRIIKSICKGKKSTFIILIHDIESIRWNKGSKQISKEISLLKMADYIIAHNDAMKKRLMQFDESFSRKAYTLNLFDYLIKPSCDDTRAKFEKNIVIAGNLSKEKSPYIYRLNDLKPKNITFDLYGSGYSKKDEHSIRYMGVFKPEDIPFRNGFGLVWDGDSIDTCSGNTGEYTRINNPHKLSLYMAAGIPVIVWKESAIAKFVEENKVGISIESLFELDEKIGAITEDEYNKFIDNVAVISERVHNGFYIRNAMERICRVIHNREK